VGRSGRLLHGRERNQRTPYRVREHLLLVPTQEGLDRRQRWQHSLQQSTRTRQKRRQSQDQATATQKLGQNRRLQAKVGRWERAVSPKIAYRQSPRSTQIGILGRYGRGQLAVVDQTAAYSDVVRFVLGAGHHFSHRRQGQYPDQAKWQQGQ